ncbi:probable staphylococcal-like nuclease CAN2 isoform X1 [Aegilops tauschii subsp. strangulata]|nr:probable staphylococcal-like nuclease CAN2 isoform X1 [Aegilops tauschii subsp. strangulata]
MLVATALGRIQGANLEGVLAYYGFPIPMPPVVTTEHHPASLPDGQFVLKTLPIYAKCIGDGDGFTAYVDTADPTESANVPQEVREAVNAMSQTPKHRNSQQKSVLQSKLNKAGYRIIYTSKDEILARQYRFRLRGIDAQEMGMQYGKESQNALVNLIAGKSVMVYVYGQDQYDRCVGDIYCDGVFIQVKQKCILFICWFTLMIIVIVHYHIFISQEQMLKEGHAWHYKIYDKCKEFAKWEMKARDARRGLWASDNPEKPWDWKRKHNVRNEASDNLDKTWEWRRKPHNARHQNTPIQVTLCT